MNQPTPSRRSQRSKSRFTLRSFLKQSLHVFSLIARPLWRIATPLLWLTGVAFVVIGGILIWTQPTDAGTTTQAALLSSAKANQDPAADNRFSALSQVQQLGLLARWSNQQTTGNYLIYMGEANTIYIEHESASGNWYDRTVKITDNHDDTFCAAIPTNATTASTAASATWVVSAAITKGALLNDYQDAMTNYAARIDLTHQSENSPTD